jgi:hypothetical protein
MPANIIDVRLPAALLFIIVNLGGCAEAPLDRSAARVPITNYAVPAGSTMDQYFQGDCAQAGNLGIGLVASHTYLYKFQERLATTKDRELKRLYVLYHLYNDLDHDIFDLEQDRVLIGMAEWRKMTPTEREAAPLGIAQRVVDLRSFDPGDPEGEIERFEQRLQKLGAKITRR